MYGLLTTLLAGMGSQLTPVSALMAFVPIRAEAEPKLGLVRPEDAAHAGYRARLSRAVAQGYARFEDGA